MSGEWELEDWQIELYDEWGVVLRERSSPPQNGCAGPRRRARVHRGEKVVAPPLVIE